MKAAQRRKLKPRDYALPRAKKYPIDTVARARNALARSAQKGTASSYPVIARAVRKRWGDAVATVGPTKGTTARPGYRKRAR